MHPDIKHLNAATYTPGRLIDAASRALGVANDLQLSKALLIDKGQISRMRSRKTPISSGMLISVMDRTGWSLTKLRELAGVPFGNATAPVVQEQKQNV